MNKDAIAALAAAKAANKPILITFVTDWCPDCRTFEPVIQGPVTAEGLDKPEYGSSSKNNPPIVLFRSNSPPILIIGGGSGNSPGIVSTLDKQS